MTIWVEPIELHGEHVSLVPLTMEHHEQLREALADGELWNLWYTSIPRPENLAAEIESESLPLFIKTPNNRNDHGNNRDCFMLNPASNSPTHAELFRMFGHFLGFTLRTKHAMNFHFPPFFWKKLLNE